MRKEDLASAIQERAGLETRAEAERALDAIVENMTYSLGLGEDVSIRGFATFQVVDRKARTGRNPQTGKSIKIPATKAVKFTPGKGLKAAAEGDVDWLDASSYARALQAKVRDVRQYVEKGGFNTDPLSQAYDNARKRLNDYSATGGEAWKEIRSGLEKAYGELRTAFKKAREKL